MEHSTVIGTAVYAAACTKEVGVESLDQIKKQLTVSLGNPGLFSLVNTRLILRTGVDLGDIRPENNRNPEAITKVLGVLTAMGYGLSPAAQK
jgi:hypothetical protein